MLLRYHARGTSINIEASFETTWDLHGLVYCRCAPTARWISHWGAEHSALITVGYIMAPRYCSGLVNCFWCDFSCSHPVPWPHEPRRQDRTLLAIAIAALPLVDPCRACELAAAHIQTWDAQGHMNISFQRCIPKELQSSMYKKIPCMANGSVSLFQKDPQSFTIMWEPRSPCESYRTNSCMTVGATFTGNLNQVADTPVRQSPSLLPHIGRPIGPPGQWDEPCWSASHHDTPTMASEHAPLLHDHCLRYRKASGHKLMEL